MTLSEDDSRNLDGRTLDVTSDFTQSWQAQMELSGYLTRSPVAPDNTTCVRFQVVQILRQWERFDRFRRELDCYMSLFRRLALLSLFLASGMPYAWAANPIGLYGTSGSSGTLAWYGFDVSVASCTEGLNGATATACSTHDGLELVAVPSGRDAVTFEIVNATSGSAIFSVPNMGGQDVLNAVLTVTPNASYLPSGSKATTAMLTTTGYNSCSTGVGCVATASAAFSAGATVTQLVDTLPKNNGLDVNPNGPNNFSTASNSFTVAETLTLNPTHTVTDLALNIVALKLTTTPEPTSITVVLIALGGLVAARRRRQFR